MSIKFFGYKACGTCKKAEKALEAMGVDFSFIDITQNPPSKTALKKMIAMSGEEIKKFYNTSGKKYKELNIKDKKVGMSEAQQVELLASDGYLLKRPLVTDGECATVGYKEDRFKEVWGE
jgi:arsenate reductase